LKLRYTNLADTSVILYRYGHAVNRQFVSHGLQDMLAQHFLIDTSNSVFTSGLPVIQSESTPGNSFVVPPTNSSFETILNVVLPLTGLDETIKLGPGEYVLRVMVSTWPADTGVAEKLRDEWARVGRLCFSNVLSEPMAFTIAKAPNRLDCSAFRVLLDAARTNPGARDASGNTALMAALYEEDPETFFDLLNRGADINAKSDNGYTALIIAAARSDSDAVRELVKRGADVNAKTYEGQSALIEALRHCDVEIVGALVEAGADVRAKDRVGKTMLDLAEECTGDDRLSIVKVLSRAGTRY